MVKSSGQKIKQLLSVTSNSILSAAFVISFFYFISAILGLFKSRAIISYFGASESLGLYYIADRIPSAIYSTIFLGTFSTVFIPLFTRLYKEDPSESFKFASNLFNVLLGFFLIISILIAIFSYEILYLLTLGQVSFNDLMLGVTLLRIMLIGQVILIISSFLTSILNAKKHYLSTSLSPVMFNLGFIVSLPLLQPFFDIYSLSWAMVVGAVFHLLIQIPSLFFIDFKYSLIANLKDMNLRESLKLSGVNFLTTLMGHLVAVAENSLAFLISASSVVYFKLADQLRYFPVHLFGASISIAALPIMAEEYKDGDRDNFFRIIKTSLLQILYLSLPVMVLLIVLKLPIVRLVYGAEKFTWEDTLITALCLAIFSLSILSQAASIFLSRCFYALKDTFHPFIATLITLTITVTFPLYFIFNGYGVWVVVTGYVVGSYINLIYFLVMLKIKLSFPLREFLSSSAKIFLSGFLMSLFLYFPMRLIDTYLLDTAYVLDLIYLTVGVSALGLVIYFVVSFKLKVPEVALLFKGLRKLKISSKNLENLENQLNQSIS